MNVSLRSYLFFAVFAAGIATTLQAAPDVNLGNEAEHGSTEAPGFARGFVKNPSDRDKVGHHILDLGGRKIELVFRRTSSRIQFPQGTDALKAGAIAPLHVQFTTNAYTIMPGPLEVYPGTYSLFVLPGDSKCTLIFNKNLASAETAPYDQAQDYGRVELKFRTTEAKNKEWSLKLVQTGKNTGRLVLAWDSSEASVDFSTM
jgi:hypothetical protein